MLSIWVFPTLMVQSKVWPFATMSVASNACFAFARIVKLVFVVSSGVWICKGVHLVGSCEPHNRQNSEFVRTSINLHRLKKACCVLSSPCFSNLEGRYRSGLLPRPILCHRTLFLPRFPSGPPPPAYSQNLVHTAAAGEFVPGRRVPSLAFVEMHNLLASDSWHAETVPVCV